MDAVIYTRVSRLADGRSTQDQERECRTWCASNQHDVEQVFTDDGISASRYGRARDAWEELKAYLRPGHILVAWEASRTTRDLGEFVALRNLCANHGVPLAYAGRVLDLTQGDDRFVGGLDALISERESEQIKTRVLRGKRTAAKDGRPPGKPPWGYRRVDVGVWEPDPIEAPRVKEAARRLIAGESMRGVWQWLDATPGRTPVDITMLRRSLSNPALAGRRIHQGEVVGAGTWEPIITERQHQQLLLRFGRAKAIRGMQEVASPEPKYLLSGIAKCGVCKEGLQHKRYEKRKDLYVCRLGHVSRIAEELDEIVEAKLFQILARVNPADYDIEDAETQIVLDDLKEVEDELEGWIQSAEKGEVSRMSFMRMEKVLNARIDRLRAKLIRIPAEVVNIASVKRDWVNWGMRRRREVIRAFFTITVPPLKRTASGGRVRATRWDVDIERIKR